MPPEIWWLSAVTLLILGAAALVDTVTSRVPDPLIFLGLLIVTATQGFYISWNFAAMHLALALASALVVWIINQLWYRVKKADAIGMGDAKWTMLAIACFDITPALFAWGFGACLATLGMGFMRATHKKIAHVYFAPFLFLGLLAGLYWLRLR
jgi:prepilin signal peptidase PulO-like enzyme (type II secretory pathway)